MNFFDYLDAKYVNSGVLNQEKFLLKREAEQRAAANLIKWQRDYFRKLSYFHLIFEFFKLKFSGKVLEKVQFKPKAEAKPTLEAVPSSDDVQA